MEALSLAAVGARRRLHPRPGPPKHRLTPNYIVSDRGTQFQSDYLAWCHRRGVRPRFGAVGRSGSIAVIERFFRSLKDEMLRPLRLVPMTVAGMARELAAYVLWYNEHRPHQGLGGRTPAEMLAGVRPARSKTVWETRPRYTLARGDPTPRLRGSKRRVQGRLVLELRRVANKPHLPIVELRHVA
jgi:hypothetical protein